MSDAPPDHFYDRIEGKDVAFCPTVLATGPWSRKFQNGVAMIGLAAHLAEAFPAPAEMVTARFVVDILKPMAMAPFTAEVTPLREGKRLQLVQVDFRQDGELAMRAIALRVRSADSPGTAAAVHALPPQGSPSFNGERSPFRHINETRLESGGLEVLGPGVVWARLSGEIVPGVAISPFVQAAMASDFGSGLSCFVDWREWSFANVDISLHLARMPKGPWVRVAASTESAGNGIAVVDTRLADLDGEFGHAHQTLFLDRRST